ncbi:hypothetical protein FHG68_16970 [Leptospira weilii]|nr:hypothetical protein FHG67_16925 [Leptospira weilii]QDK28173.1 hypothetical protein FHG68_16970 [Leptospira weilii]
MDAWHKNWQFHFTPTYSSWINQVEIFFRSLPGSVYVEDRSRSCNTDQSLSY